MSRTYPPHSPYSATTRTRRTVETPEPYPLRYGNYGGPERYASSVDETEVLNDVEDYDDYNDADYDDDGYTEYRDPIDRRWIWVAGVAGAILLIAVICTVVILGGGDSGSVSKTIAPPAATTSQVPTSTAPRVATSAPLPPPPAPLTPETVTSVTPAPTAAAEPAPTVSAPAPSTITYQVTGSRQLLDLVTVIYTDAQGALQTDFNVALPWSKTVVLNPGVTLGSVTATSVGGQLNCSITDAGGAVVAAQATNSMIASCTK
ncbi:MmpS family transport accessory protein [Mycobacterium sp. URHB0044]|uniref:MmpS family transport accessory protein n=1 Tax=Mycobacterium sp. URHB0044 TaxID=1380386 RepID=UPI00048B4784|nr:MmpS family transport accessory protein [Mycobacterium sp. URHB0044]